MTRIVYTVLNNEARLSSFREGGAALIEVCVESIEDGIISIGPHSRRLRGGECRFSLSGLMDGDYTPKLCLDGEIIRLGEIRKVGNKLTRPPIKPEIVDKLIERIDALELANREILQKLSLLEAKINPTFTITNQA